MKITRRPTSEADAAFVRDVYHRAYRDVSERQFGRWDEKLQDQFFEENWGAVVHEIILCDGTPCGYTCIEERDADIHVRELVIAPEFQGQGIGTQILADVQKTASGRGVPVRLGTFHVNRAANLYRRLGFQKYDQTDSHILMEWNNNAK